MVTALLVALGGAVGAPVRFVVDGEVRRWLGERWPGGTLIVNVLGALLLGVVTRLVEVGAGGIGWLPPLVGTGLCGALTTFSAFSYDAWVLIVRRVWFGVVAYIVLTLVLGIGGFLFGWSLVG